jgi:hypothetical protein
MNLIYRVLVLPVTDVTGHTNRDRIRHIEGFVLVVARGYTITECEGAWLDQGGRVVPDRSCELRVLATPQQDDTIVAQIPKWTRLLGQECILTYSTIVDADYVYGNRSPKLAGRAEAEAEAERRKLPLGTLARMLRPPTQYPFLDSHVE